jgi:hypothetical protein
MSREAFEKAYHEETGLYASWSPNNKGYTDVIAGMCYRMWQAAQAQAVNQQLPNKKPLPDLMMASYHEAKGWNDCLAAIEAAQEQGE